MSGHQKLFGLAIPWLNVLADQAAGAVAIAIQAIMDVVLLSMALFLLRTVAGVEDRIRSANGLDLV